MTPSTHSTHTHASMHEHAKAEVYKMWSSIITSGNNKLPTATPQHKAPPHLVKPDTKRLGMVWFQSRGVAMQLEAVASQHHQRGDALCTDGAGRSIKIVDKVQPSIVGDGLKHTVVFSPCCHSHGPGHLHEIIPGSKVRQSILCEHKWWPHHWSCISTDILS